MSDLYGALGVDRNADHGEIRKAYRKMAKKSHPDAGGSAEEFALVKLAHDVLMDANRRAHYDRTGEFKEKEPNNEQAQIMNLISRCLDMVLSAENQNGSMETVFYRDLVAMLKAKINELVKKSHAADAEMENGIKINERLAKKFRRKHKTEEPNLMELLVTGRIRTFQDGIANQKHQRKIALRSLELLSDYDFESEKMSPEQMRQNGLNILMTAIQNMR